MSRIKRREFQEAHVLAGIPTFFRAPHVSPGLQSLKDNEVSIAVVGVPYEGGNTYRPGASYGPHWLRTATAQVAGYLHQHDFDLFNAYNIVDYGDVPVTPVDINRAHRQIADYVRPVLDAGALPILVGGDHSISTGGVTSLCESTTGRVGLLILDSHIDTKDSIAGQDISSNGAWIAKVSRLPNLSPQNVAIIGARGATIPRECWDFARKTGMTVIAMEEVREVGVEAAVVRGLKAAQHGTAALYVSYDIDSIDPAYAPGTGAPEPGGFSSVDVQKAAYLIGGAKPNAFDIVELFMCYDPSGITAVLASNIILYTLAGIHGSS